MIKCSVCGKYIPEKSQFCHECGAPVDTFALEKSTCPTCGTIAIVGDVFCRGCGEPLPKIAKRKPVAIGTPVIEKQKFDIDSMKKSKDQMRYMSSVKTKKPIGLQSGYMILFLLTLLAGVIFILGNQFYYIEESGDNLFISVSDCVTWSVGRFSVIELVFGGASLSALIASFIPGGWGRIFALFTLGASCFGGYIMYDTFQMLSNNNIYISLGGYVALAVLAVDAIASLVAIFNRSF